VIGRKLVVENHQPRTIDVEGLYREVRAFCAKGLTPQQRAHADFLRKIKPMPRSRLRGRMRITHLIVSGVEPTR